MSTELLDQNAKVDESITYIRRIYIFYYKAHIINRKKITKKNIEGKEEN